MRSAILRVVSSNWGAFVMKIPKDRDQNFQIARSLAIEAYANLEYALSKLFAQLMDVPEAKASIAFFRIQNNRARNSVVSDLLGIEHGTQYDAYWHGEKVESGQRRTRGLLGLIRSLDDRRNDIVHWHTVRGYDLTPTGMRARPERLEPIISWHNTPREERAQKLTTTNLKEFTAKCEFVARSIHNFRKFTTTEAIPIDLAERDTWLRIFQQPVSYPPSDSHPLSPNYKAPGTLPPSSRA